MKRAIVLVTLALVCVTGCYRTEIVAARGIGKPAARANDLWYHGLVGGVVDLSGPLDLDKLCPNGEWTEINVRTSFLNGLLGSMILWGIWSPQTVTVYCGGEGKSQTARSSRTSGDRRLP